VRLLQQAGDVSHHERLAAAAAAEDEEMIGNLGREKTDGRGKLLSPVRSSIPREVVERQDALRSFARQLTAFGYFASHVAMNSEEGIRRQMH
jgi:hypothetical protein